MIGVIFIFLVISVLAIVLGVTLRQTNVRIVTPTPTPTPTPTAILEKTLLFDTFTQAGTGTIPLSSHTPEVGGPWKDFNAAPELELFLGQGYCTNITASVDINQSCVCLYDNLKETLFLTMEFTIPSTITNLGNLAGLVSGFVDDNANGYTFQFFYDPLALTYAVQLVQITGGVFDYVLATKNGPAPPPLDQKIVLTANVKPSGRFTIHVLDVDIAGQGIYSSIIDDLHNYVVAIFRGDPTELININLEEVLIKSAI